MLNYSNDCSVYNGCALKIFLAFKNVATKMFAIGCNFNELSLKCTLGVVKMKYKSSFFFRTVQEWNRLPPDLRMLEVSDEFREKLLTHLKRQAFTSELEPD